MAKYRVKDWDRENFPGLFRAADDVSNTNQGRYLFWIRANLACLLVGAVAAVGGNWPDDPTVLRWISAGAFLAGLGVSVLIADRGWERKWFAGRAVAESVKSLSWKYVTGAEPLPITLGPADARTRLTDQFQELMKEHKSLAADLVTPDIMADQITSWMDTMRAAPVAVRRDVYLAQRVGDQQAWYANASVRNGGSQHRWFAAFLLTQAVALATMIYEALNVSTNLQAGELLATLAAAVLAWTQIKRFQELAQSYGLAAQELSMIAARGPHALTEDRLARFVADAETAISREHTAWVARRETT